MAPALACGHLTPAAGVSSGHLTLCLDPGCQAWVLNVLRPAG
eukprot:CAMPEP_0175221988 /NCGR_PEP_ID=MMETSP0093-20121207/20590_1 /TAXON_ID=311494 /ORGANISM="Alexandrium monilatum, Strain CCMP3105" /LENGTH=41 /DNA_ID= /DNA_START= /DNA_END= /DNA_ORIENTATION=